MSQTNEQSIISDHLYSRENARRILGGISVASLIRLERANVLKPIRLNKHSPTGQVYYTGSNLRETVLG